MDRKKRLHVTKIQQGILLGIIILVGFFVMKGLLSVTRFMNQTGLTPGLIVKLLVSDGIPLKAQDGRTNILILGIGGGTHEGADLTDSIMIVSLSATSSAAFISVPRDIWSDTLKDKVNSAYHYGELKKKGGGLTLSKVVIEDVVGIPIQYALLLDFSEFKNIVDQIGGVDVQVEKGFTDTEYPIAGKEQDECGGDPEKKCRYETIQFTDGLQHMDGEVALQYIRSRHAEGLEGSDFARSKRQQELLVALKNKLTQPDKWFSLSRAATLVAVLDEATDTDMNLGELLSFGKRFIKIKSDKVSHISFESLLYTPPNYLYGRYVLLPLEDFETIHEYIKTQLQ